MSKIKELNVQGRNVRFLTNNGLDYVCITDIAALKNPLEPKDVVKNWLRSRSTLSFIGLWEKLHNPDFKGVDFDPLKLRIIKLLPKAQIFYCRPQPHPVLYYILWFFFIFKSRNIS